MSLTRDGSFLLLILGAIAFAFVGLASKFPSVSLPSVSFSDNSYDYAYADRYFVSHAVEKHGSDAVAVRSCIENKGVHSLWFEPKENNYVQVCQLDNGVWGMRVCKTKACKIEDEVTAFIKNKMSRLDQVFNYLSNHGAIRLE